MKAGTSTRPRFYTVAELARAWHRSRASITTLIESGQLRAFNCSPDGKIRQLRISAEAIAEFEKQQMVMPGKKKELPKRQPRDPDQRPPEYV